MMGAWAVRFRVAAAACCAAVVVLLAAGVIAGLALETSTSTLAAGLQAPARPRGAAAFGRAQVVFSGANLLTAVLLVVAVLLVMVAGSGLDAEPDARATAGVLRAVEALAGVVTACALVMGGVTVWYGVVGTGPGLSAQVVQRLGSSLSTAVVAAASLWWAAVGVRR
jgi:hypothetical protein